MSFDYDKHSKFILEIHVIFFFKIKSDFKIPTSEWYPNARKASILNEHLLIKGGKMGNVG